MRIRMISVFGLSLLLVFIFLVPLLDAQKLTHTVEEGDTLWDICEKYYGDPDLWPKLWQMNPFITNPHLLKRGDLITLFEKEEMVPAEKEEAEEKTAPVKEPDGIGLSNLTDLSKRGYLSKTPIEAYGEIFATKGKRLALYKDDTAYILISKPGVKEGDEFLVGQVIGPLKDPFSDVGAYYLFSVHGRIRIETRAGLEFDKKDTLLEKENTYQAKVISSFKPVSVGDVILPPEPISECIKPASFAEPVLANIVATRDQRNLVGKYDIVYLNQGWNQSIQRGHLFEIVKPEYTDNPKPIYKKVFRKNILVLPDRPIGLLLVIDTRPDTSTGLILTIKETMAQGAYLKSQAWDDHPELLSRIQTCNLD